MYIKEFLKSNFMNILAPILCLHIKTTTYGSLFGGISATSEIILLLYLLVLYIVELLCFTGC